MKFNPGQKALAVACDRCGELTPVLSDETNGRGPIRPPIWGEFRFKCGRCEAIVKTSAGQLQRIRIVVGQSGVALLAPAREVRERV